MKRLPYMRIDPLLDAPLYMQITEQCIGLMRRREWKHGDTLPGVRQLANRLDVSLETVQRAYHRLQQEGWVASRPRTGTVVIADIPAQSTPIPLPAPEAKRRAGFVHELRRIAEQPGILPVSGGSSNADADWLAELQRFAPEAVRRATHQESFDPFGLPALRSHLQGWLTGFGCYVDNSRICVVSGTQQGLHLVANHCVAGGQTVFVPDMCYLAAEEVFRDRGASIRTLPMSADGVALDPLERALAAGEPVSLVYAMPNGHYPTGWSFTAAQKQRLLALAQQHSFAIVEDDYFVGFHYGDVAPSSLLSIAPESPNLFYLCSFSNITHPSLRLGMLVCPADRADALERAKYLTDTHTSAVLQQLLLQLLETGVLQASLERQRRRNRQRCGAALASCQRWLPSSVSFQPPEVGHDFWVRTPDRLGMRFFQACVQAGVLVMPEEAFSLTDGSFGFQVNFATVDESTLDEGLRRVGIVLTRMLDG